MHHLSALNSATMSAFHFLADAALYTGIFYLQSKVSYSLLKYDLPATSSCSSETANSNHARSTSPQQQAALDYYCNRKTTDLSYKVVPVACILLTVGVLANVFLDGSLGNYVTLLASLLTAYNNGQNVVNPANALAADAKGDKQEDVLKVLKGITRGHWIDFMGFTVIFLTKACELLIDWKKGNWVF